MCGDWSNYPFLLNNPEQQDEKISRRDLLKASAKAAVGLTIVPLPYEIKVMASELLNDISPTGFILANSASNSACNCIPQLAGDVDGDNIVDEDDMAIMANEWLNSATSALSNLDRSCTYIPNSAGSEICVDFEDYSILADDWRCDCSAQNSASAFFRNFSSKRRLV
jgi:hypothetical protein